MIADTLLDEFDADDPLAAFRGVAHQFLLRGNAQEVVDEIEFSALRKQRITAEAGALGDDDAFAFGGELYLSQNLERGAERPFIISLLKQWQRLQRWWRRT